MRNRFTRACYALAAGVAVTTTLGLTAAGAASASTTHIKPNATPPCGPFCINPYTAKYGPGYVLQNFRAINGVGNPLKLQFANNNAPGQDWTIFFQGSVNRFFHFGLVSGNLAFHYGHEPAYELQWSPFGVNTGPARRRPTAARSISRCAATTPTRSGCSISRTPRTSGSSLSSLAPRLTSATRRC